MPYPHTLRTSPGLTVLTFTPDLSNRILSTKQKPIVLGD